MQGITIADSPHSVVIVLDKTFFPKDNLDRAIASIEKEALDLSHIPYVDEEEMADIAASLSSMSAEDRAVAIVSSRNG